MPAEIEHVRAECGRKSLNGEGEALIRPVIIPGLGVVLMMCAGAAASLRAGAAPGTGHVARTLYVSAGGNDANAGTISEPLATPVKAVGEAAAGDSICIRSGVYYLNRPLLIDKPGLTVRSFDGELAHLKAPIDEGKGVTSVIVVAASDVALAGLEVEGGSFYGIKIDAEPGHSTSGVSIRGCRIHDTGRDCVKTFNADRLSIQGCEIGPSGKRDPSDAEGIDSIGSVGVVIQRCWIHDTATNGLYLKGGARDGIVEQCRIENISGFAGILLGEDTDQEFMRDGSSYEAINCIARNNIVINTGAAGLATYSGSNIRFENNTLYHVAENKQAAFWIVTNSRNVPAEQIALINNIAAMSGSRPFVLIQNLAGRLDCDYNIYFDSGGWHKKKFVSETTGTLERYDQWSFADWQRIMGVDSHSMMADPLLDSEDSYTPLPGSPAIGRGKAPPGPYTDYQGAVPLKDTTWNIGAVQRRAVRGARGVNFLLSLRNLQGMR